MRGYPKRRRPLPALCAVLAGWAGAPLGTAGDFAANLGPYDVDTYAYHDWHFGGNGDVATFMAALAEQFGAGSRCCVRPGRRAARGSHCADGMPNR